MKKLMNPLLVVCLFLGFAGCGRDPELAKKEKSAMVIPMGGRPIDPLQKNMMNYYPRPNR